MAFLVRDKYTIDVPHFSNYILVSDAIKHDVCFTCFMRVIFNYSK